MPTPELVIFDCDGVLVDSEPISNAVLAGMLTDSGLPTTTQQARSAYQGLLLKDILAIAQSRLGHELPDGWLTEFEHRRAEAFQSELQPIDGAAATVQQIKAAGIAVCVASQGKLSKTALSLKLTGLDRLFPEPTRFSAYEVPRGKPHPDLFLHAAESMGASPHACVVIEDSLSGVRAAHAAGMKAIAYASGDMDAATLRNAGATIVDALTALASAAGIDS